MADSLESFDDTTTCAATGAAAPRARTALRASAPVLHNDLKRFPTEGSTAVHRGQTAARYHGCTHDLPAILRPTSTGRGEWPLLAVAAAARGAERPARLVARLGQGGSASALSRGD